MENVVEVNQTLSEKKGITGSTLKLIAIISMLIDHTGAIILERMLVARGMDKVVDVATSMAFFQDKGNLVLYWADMLLRLIGRLGFPIFCFLLVEGFLHTRNMKKYVGRLFLFALVSEVPFDLGFMGVAFGWGHQNVFFTLLIGLLVLIGIRFAEEKKEWHIAVRVLLGVLFSAAGMAAAYFLNTDYDLAGVLAIILMYLFRRKKMLGTGLACLTLTVKTLMELPTFLVMIPIHLYNGKRGWNIKWLFYAFYPVHILLLYLIARFLNLGDVMMVF